MPFRNNVYHDPSIAKGFSNIASVFAPPTGMEMYGYAKAGVARADEARKAAAMANINAGKGSLGDYIAAGVANPVTSYGRAGMLARSSADPSLPPSAFDTGAFILNGNANNTFEGQGRKLAVDTANNVRDNNTKVVVAGLTPVQRDAVRYVPPAAVPTLGYGGTPSAPSAPSTGNDQPTISSMFGPAAPGVVASAAPASAGGGMTQTGGMEVRPGSKVYLPNGQVLEGTDKPQSVDQVRATEIARRLQANPNDPIVQAIIAGDIKTNNVMGPNGQPQVATVPQSIGQAPAPKQANPTELAQLQSERGAIAAKDPNDPRIKEYDARIAALGRGQHQSAYDEANDKNFAKMDEDIFTRAQTAAANQSSLNVLQNLVKQGMTDQGKWASMRTEVRKAMNSLGLNGGDTSPMEVMQALGNKLALELRNPAQGAGMPGSLSDSDRNFLSSMVANPDHSFEANSKLLDIYSKMNQRAIDIENMRRSYIKDHGRLDEGFRNQLSDFTVKHPIFAADNSTTQPAPAAGAAPQPTAAPAAPAAAAPATPDQNAAPAPAATPAAPAVPKRLKYNPATGEIE